MVLETGEVVAPDFAGAAVPIIDLAGEIKMDPFDIVG